MGRSLNRALLSIATACMGLGAFPATTLAQRCVAADDRTDIPLDHRYCGADLIDLGIGTAGFGDESVASDGCLHLNDDESGPSINILPYFPGGLRFFSMRHNSLYLNTNGNITFSEPVGTYTPDAFPVADQPMIAPFWADVDTRTIDGVCTGSDEGTCYPRTEDQVWWHFEPGRAYFTWDEVSYFGCNTDRRNSFQLILSAAEGCGGTSGGDFDVEFRYNRCEWDTGDASGGEGGFLAGPPSDFEQAAQAGFDAGDSLNYVEIMTSRETRTIIRTLCEESNVGTPGVWRFTIRSGTVICPGAGDVCTATDEAGMPLLGACADGRTNCVGSGIECVPQIEPRGEICDNIDNDCDGEVDDGTDTDLCFSDGQSCVSGVCVDNCFEGSCTGTLTCNAENVCVDPTCDGVTCDEGERCSGGVCVPACEGISCPEPTSCVAGRCINACAGLTCDDCTTCDGGACIPRCTTGSCEAGLECDTLTGRCVSSGCIGVDCAAGTVCRSGGCVDACLDAVCPAGDVCMAGVCVRRERPDAGPPMDAGMRDAGAPDTGAMDVGPVDARIDGGRDPQPLPSGCGCSATTRSSGGFSLLGLLGLAIVLRRRR